VRIAHDVGPPDAQIVGAGLRESIRREGDGLMLTRNFLHSATTVGTLRVR
jgi:hypothetical protein